MVLAVMVVTLTAGAMLRLKMFPAAAGAYGVSCVLADGIWEGEISFGSFAAVFLLIQAQPRPVEVWARNMRRNTIA